MILLRSKGGLGNQVFQIIHAIMNSNDKEKIYVDCSLFKMKFADDYAGMHFLASKVIAETYKNKISYFSVGHVASRLFWRVINSLNAILKVFNLKLLDGYFSDIRLFPESVDYQKMFDLNCDFKQFGIDKDSVIIHVRKGDYTNAINSKIYNNCDVDYFKKSVELMKQKVPNAKFYIMSNDNNWVKENFIFLDTYQLLDIEDPILSFKVMSHFKNFIISNSTFSWWPAFISKSNNVFVPSKWYLDESKNINLYPDKWTKV